ncbi:methyltransferase domain-containing protein [Micromonospora luteifusca]|uniref:methyltransferase domain-containing protein n=1 Tax=Micromonospora luteifusca TaxID=709860 RepID=UPI0033BF010F
MTIPPDADYDTALTLAGDAARILYEAGAQRVWLAGSLAHAQHWDARSDIDFGTIGLPRIQFSAAVARLRRRLGRHVDVIPLEDAPSFIRTQILLEMLPVGADGGVEPRNGPAPPYPVATLTGPPYPKGLHQQRHAVASDVLNRRGVRKALDVGCAQGEFELAALRRWPQKATEFHGIDPDTDAVRSGLEQLDRELDDRLRSRARLDVAEVADLPHLWADHDAVVAIEVIEHLDEPTLELFARLVFRELSPPTVVLTTPNAEYNVLFPEDHPSGRPRVRHPGHHFEWTRSEMRRWIAAHAAPAGYRAALRGIGEAHPMYGPPTQLWVLSHDR